MTDLVTRDPTTGLRYTPTRWTQTGTTPPPDGCRWCGHEQRGHYRRWKPSAGWHTWTAPTDKQRLARMRARRAQRLALPPEPTIPLLPDGTPDLTGASIVVPPGDSDEPWPNPDPEIVQAAWRALVPADVRRDLAARRARREEED